MAERAPALRAAAILALCGAACAAVAWPPPAAAQRANAYAAGAAGAPLGDAQRMERHFLQVAAASLRFQAEASLLARSRSSNPAVRDLAAALLARHKSAHPELLHLLQARGMAMPMPVSGHSKVLKELGKLNGARFDSLYVDAVVMRSYRADIEVFEQAAGRAGDPVLKAWIQRQLPTLRVQLAQAGRALPAVPLRAQRAL